VPKLFFKAVRPLDEEELQQVVALKDSPATVKAITFTVAQTDGVDKSAPKAEAPKKKEAAKPLFDNGEDAPVEEPTKVVKKTSPAPSGDDGDLSSIIDNWDD
jgi:hypothetical protein